MSNIAIDMRWIDFDPFLRHIGLQSSLCKQCFSCTLSYLPRISTGFCVFIQVIDNFIVSLEGIMDGKEKWE